MIKHSGTFLPNFPFRQNPWTGHRRIAGGVMSHGRCHDIPWASMILWLIPMLAALLLSSSPLDRDGFLLINRWASGFPDTLWTILSSLGNGWICLALVLPLLQAAPRLFVAALYSGAMAALVTQVLKHALDKARPAAILDPESLHVIGQPLFHHALPSGHTLTVFAIATGLYFGISTARRLNYAWILVLAGLSGLARIGVGAHWPQDIAAGMALGVICGLLGASLTKRLHGETDWRRRDRCPLVLALGLGCIINLAGDPLEFPTDALLQHMGAGILALVMLGQAILARPGSRSVEA